MALTLRQKIGQSFIIGISGKTLTDEERSFIVDNCIGGIILFARNIESPKQVHALNQDIQNLRHKMASKTPLFISVDMEGGRVARLKAPFTQWPPLKKLGDAKSPSLSFKFAEAMGKELRAVGFNLDFAPCVDVLTNPANVLIGDRSISTDPNMVEKIASALVRGYIVSGVLPCAKHFPGHGNTVIDSHFDLPVEEVDYERLKSIELIPFKKTFRARLDFVMTAHIKFTSVDAEWPVTLSEKFLKDILRKDMGYRKLVITDDLDMKALANHYDKSLIPVRSLQAGANVLLYCNEPESYRNAITAIEKAVADGTLKQEVIENNYQEILKVKNEHLQQPDLVPFDEALHIVGHPDHLRLSKAIASGEIPADLNT